MIETKILLPSISKTKIDFIFFFSENYTVFETNTYLFFFFNIFLFCYFLICNISRGSQDFTKDYIFYSLLAMLIFIYFLTSNIFQNIFNFLDSNIFHFFFIFYKSFELEIQSIFIAILYSIFLIFLNLNLKQIKNIEYETIFILNILITSIFAILNEKNLILIYLLLEIQVFCIFFIVSLKKNIISSEATIKYILINVITSSFLLLSIFFFYQITGSLNLSILSENFFNFNIQNNSNLNNTFYFIFILFVLIFLFKLGIPPLHIWYLNIYNGTFFYFLIFLLIFSKIGYIIFFFNLFKTFKFLFLSREIFKIILIFFILFCFFIGTLGAISENNIKKILIYSSIYQLGFFLIIVFIDLFFFNNIFFFNFSFFENIENIFNIMLFFYFPNNLLMLLSFFLIQNKNNYRINNIIELKFYEKKKNKIFLCMFLILLFSSIGIPPLLGFFSKYYIFSFLLENKLFFLLLISIIISVLSSFYYLRIINNLYLQNTTKISNFKLHTFTIYFVLYFILILFLLIPFYFLNLFENLYIFKVFSFF